MKRSYFTLGSILLLFAAAGLQAQTLTVNPTSLALSAQANGSPVSQTINVTSSAGAVSFFAFNNSVSWLKVNSSTSATGTTPSALTVTADPTGLQPSIYTGTIGVIGGTSSISVTVTFTVGNVSVSPAAVAFTYQMGGTAPQSTTVNITSAQPTAISLTAATTSGGSWLVASLTGGTATTGTSPNTAIISVSQTVLQTLAAGTYNGTVTITPTSGTSTTPATVAVTLTVTPAPPVTVSPAAITLGYQIGGTNNSPQQALTLATTGAQGVAYAIATTVNPNPAGRVWFTVNPSGGTIPANGNTQVTVAYDTTANLPAGTWTGTITLETPGGTPVQQTINVTLVISPNPLVNVANPALTFNYQVGTVEPVTQNVTVSSTGTQLPLTITYTPQNSWLSAAASGVTGTAFPVSVGPTGLQPGTYTGTVTVTASGAANGPLQISVTLVVTNNPVIVVTMNGNGCSTAINQSCPMLFAAQVGQAGPPAQNITITSSTGAALNYTVSVVQPSCGGAWLVPNFALSTSGTTNAVVPIVVNAGGVAAGSVCNENLSIAATIASTGAAAPNSPLIIPVTMYVSSSDLLVANPYALTFTAPESGQSPAAQTISVTSTGTNVLNYTVSPTITSGSNWLFVNQVSGSTASGSSQLAVQVAPGLLSPGTYFGTIAITATGPASAAVADATTASPLIIQVTFQVTAGNMTVSPTSLSFTQTAAGSAPAAQTISVASSAQALSYNVTAAVTTTSGNVNWLSATPASGTTPGSISVSVNGAGLPAGVYNGAVTIAATTPATGGSPATIPVTLTVLAGTISAAPMSLTFAQVVSSATPATQTVTVSGTPGAISYAVTTAEDANGAAVNWLSATPATGSTPGTVTVSASAGSLPLGSYTGKVVITAASPGANGSPISIPITLNVVTGQTLSVSPTALTFSYSLGASAPPAQTVQVSATGVAAPFTTAIATSPSGGTWLAVSPTSGTTPATLSVTVSPSALAAGNYTGTITISSSSSLNPVTVTVSLVVSSIPMPVISAIGNAASYATGGVSPGENIVIFGIGIGPATLTGGTLTASNAFSTTAGNTQVTFDGTPAPVIYASATQTSVMVPYGVSGRTVTTIRVSYQGVLSSPLIYNVATVAPGIYTQNSSGTGPGSILNQDYSINGPTKPAAKGTVVAVYMTGEGTTNTVPLDGAIAPVNGTGLYKPLLPVTATVGGVPATVLYYGSAPGIVYGVMQVDVTVPSGVASGPQPIVITVGSNNTQAGVTVAVQ